MFYCNGSKTCGIESCPHYVEHERTETCHLDNCTQLESCGGCVEVKTTKLWVHIYS